MKKSTKLMQVVAIAVATLWTKNVLAAQQVTIPEGTVIELRMETGLNSESSRVNDTFKASVLRSVWIDGRVAAPENSNVNGRVTMVQPAERSSRSGVIGVEFNQITVNGRTYAIEGTLTSLRADERKQIIDDESRVKGKSSTSRNILFIGGGAGVGAAIGAVTAGGKGAGIGALTGGAMQLVRAVSINTDTGLRQTTANDRTLYTGAAMVRGAQTALRQRKYYSGASSGRLDDATRRSLAHYQIDNNQPATGDLDQATAASLGLIRTGEAVSSNVALAERQRATDINRKAVLLLAGLETRLGVRVDDIRSRQTSEQDLDLLLQVHAFAKAAVWYEQVSKSGINGNGAFTNSGRILLRSARRVEQGMETASQDRKFSDAWSGIQNNLRQITLDLSFSVR